MYSLVELQKIPPWNTKDIRSELKRWVKKKLIEYDINKKIFDAWQNKKHISVRYDDGYGDFSTKTFNIHIKPTSQTLMTLKHELTHLFQCLYYGKQVFDDLYIREFRQLKIALKIEFGYSDDYPFLPECFRHAFMEKYINLGSELPAFLNEVEEMLRQKYTIQDIAANLDIDEIFAKKLINKIRR